MSRIFEHRSVMHTTIDRMVAFHTDPHVLTILTPPPLFVRIKHDNRKSLYEGEVEFTLWIGFLPIPWLARHEPGPNPHSFADRMIQGPLASWLHQHIISEADGGVELIDRVTFAHKPGISGLLTRLLFDGLPLRILFLYRHFRTRRAVERK